MPKHLDFVELPNPGHRTKSWMICSKTDTSARHPIGSIRWHAPWRKYCYFTLNYPSCQIFDATCLGEMIEFLNEQNAKHKEELRVKKSGS